MPALIIVAAAVAAYVNSLFSGFVMDDVSIIVENPLVQKLSNVPLLFSTSYWLTQSGAGTMDVNYYRPLTMLSYATDFALHSTRPMGFHFTNLLLHSLVCVFIYFLLTSLDYSRRQSFLAALVFAVLPIHTEAVSNIVGRAEILAACFLLGAWRLAHRSNRRLNLMASGGFFLLALMSKESAICFPLALLLSEWRASKKPLVQIAKERGLVWAMFFAEIGLFLEWRHLILKSYLPVTSAPYFIGQTFLVRLLTVAKFFFVGYAWPMLSGLGLCADYLRPTFPDASVSDPMAWVCLLGALSLVGFATVNFIRKRSRIAFGILLFFIFYLPVSNLFFDIAYDLGAERFMYLPSLGFAIVAAVFIDRLFSASVRLGLLVIVPLMLGWTLLTIRRNGDWKSETTLYASLVRDKPTNPTGWNGVGTVLEKQNKPTDARACYLKALSLNHSMASAVYNMGASYFYEGDYKNAKQWFLKNVGATTLQAETFTFLGLIEMDAKNYTKALENFERAEKINPFDPIARSNRDILLKKISDKSNAT